MLMRTGSSRESFGSRALPVVFYIVLSGSLIQGTVLGSAAIPGPIWIRQLGTAGTDEALDVSADGLGNVYITGRTGNELGGATAGLSDAYVAKYDQAGHLQWVRQLGSSSADYGFGIAADRLGNVFIAGRTEGVIVPPGAGQLDAFVAKYDSFGDQVWVRQFGTSGFERVNDAATDGLGNVYLTGFTNGNLGLPGDQGSAFVTKFDTDGHSVWTRRLGATVGEGYAVSTDGLGNVYVSGENRPDYNDPNHTGLDAFVSKLDDTGNILWSRQLGTRGTDFSRGVSADGLGSVYVSGTTNGSLGGANHGGNTTDVFVSRFDDLGNLVWARQFGSRGHDKNNDIATDASGNVFVTGATDGNFFGLSADGGFGRDDVFLFKLAADGTLRWGHQFGIVGDDFGLGVSVDRFGSVFVAGWTDGSLGGPNAGGSDAFVAKFLVPEPGAGGMVLIGAMLVAARRRRMGNVNFIRQASATVSSPPAEINRTEAASQLA